MRTEDLDQTDLQRRYFTVPVEVYVSITRSDGNKSPGRT